MFTTAASTITQIMGSDDEENKLNENITTLNKIYQEHYLPLKLYERVKNSLSYQHKKDITDITDFVD